MDVFTLCFSEKLPTAGNLAFILEGNDLIWNAQCFPPQIQRAGLTTVQVLWYMWLFHRFFYEKPQHVKKWISIAVTLVDSNFQLKWTDFLPHFIWPWVKKKPALDLRLPSFMQDLDQFFIIHKMQFVFLCSFLVGIYFCWFDCL